MTSPIDLYSSTVAQLQMPATVIIPCYNEERRWDSEAFVAAKDIANLSFLFVDDGSSDRTSEVLERTAQKMSRAKVLRLEKNSGKGEAVRRGLLAALEAGAPSVGYLDADLSAPISEMVRILSVLQPGQRDVALGSRILLLGTMVRRSPVRHYLGRIFATAASLTLGIPVYDTQCGAKAFVRTPALEAALTKPFNSRWAFDVELIGRIILGMNRVPPTSLDRFAEVPLRRWIHVGGSKIKLMDLPKMALELLRIRRCLRKLR